MAFRLSVFQRRNVKYIDATPIFPVSDAVNEIVRMYGEVVSENVKRATDSVAELRALGAYLQTLDCIIKQLPV